MNKRLHRYFYLIVLILFCFGLCGSLFAEDAASAIIGTWKHDKEGLTFQFNADGTFTMGEEGEAVRKAIEREQRGRGESAITSVSGTYTATKNRIEMLMFVDGKTHKIPMSSAIQSLAMPFKICPAGTIKTA